MYTKILLLTAIIGIAHCADAGFGCVQIKKGDDINVSAWNLGKINNDKMTSAPWNNGTVEWKSCGDVPKWTSAQCDSVKSSNPVGVAFTSTSCTALSQSTGAETDTKWTFSAIIPPSHESSQYVDKATKKVFYMLRNSPMANQLRDAGVPEVVELQELPGTGTLGLKIQGDNSKNTLGHNVELQYICNQAGKPDQVDSTSATMSGNTYTLMVTSKDACGFSPFSFWDKLSWGQYIVEGVLVVFCLIMCFYGHKIYKPSIGFIGFAAGAGLTYALLVLFVDPITTEAWYMWVVIGVSALVGITLCILFIVIEKLSLFGAGVFGGFIAGQELYTLVLSRFDGAGTPVWYYVTIIALAIVGGILTLWLHDTIIMLVTAIGGAYVSVRMIGMMIGDYPDEASIARAVAAGAWSSFPWYLYAYPLGQIVLAVIGTIVQCCMYHKAKKEEKNENNQDYSMI